MMDPHLAIVGPTASGKTLLSLTMARRLNGEIISADSRQIYRYLTIGTSKPGEQERKEVPHHCVDILDPREIFSAGQFARYAGDAIAEIRTRGRTTILVGGSGLYVRAAIDGFFDGPSAQAPIRSQLERRLKDEGIDGLLRDLESVDPKSAAIMRKEPKLRRVVRALEVYYATGTPLSEHHRSQPRTNVGEWLQIGLEWQRPDLYKRIDDRVDQMIQDGFLDEVRWLKEHGYDRTFNALNTVGYKEVFDFLAGKHPWEKCVELIKRNTRRFAKRQLTWFRADKRIQWVPLRNEPDWDVVADRVDKIYRQRRAPS